MEGLRPGAGGEEFRLGISSGEGPTEFAPGIFFGCVHCLPGDQLPLSSPLPPGSPSSAQFTFSGSQNKAGSWEYDQNPLN